MSHLQTFINTNPQSVRVAEANRLIDELRKKLEMKELKSATLYYNLGEYRAAGVTFSVLLDTYPESNAADEYKYMAVKSFYKAAELTVITKRAERLGEVIAEANDFISRFPDSKYRKDIESYISSSNTEIQKISNNEQVKTTT